MAGPEPPGAFSYPAPPGAEKHRPGGLVSRTAFLTGLYADLGLPPQRARLLARLAYATYIGLMRITAEAPAARLSTEELEAFTDEATRALLPPTQ